MAKQLKIIVASIIVLGLTALALGGALYFKGFMTDLYEPVPIPPVTGIEKTVLCLGDSITHGNVSANYIDKLSTRFEGESIRFVNGGINGDMVYNVADRLDHLLEKVPEPDLVTLLIGTNDANAGLDAKVAQRAIDHPEMGRIPDEKSYKESLEALAARIADESGAELILISIPPIGEEPETIEWERSMSFSSIAGKVAAESSHRYVPFGEELARRIMASPPDREELPSHQDWYAGVVKGIVRRHFMNMNYNDIGDLSSYRFHSDQLHLNERAVDILVDLLEPVIRTGLE